MPSSKYRAGDVVTIDKALGESCLGRPVLGRLSAWNSTWCTPQELEGQLLHGWMAKELLCLLWVSSFLADTSLFLCGQAEWPPYPWISRGIVHLLLPFSNQLAAMEISSLLERRLSTSIS